MQVVSMDYKWGSGGSFAGGMVRGLEVRLWQ